MGSWDPRLAILYANAFPRGQRTRHQNRPRGARRAPHAAVLAARRAGLRDARRAPGQGGPPDGRGPRPVQARRARLGPGQPLLRAPRRRPRLRPARERRPALPLPRLALRQRRPLPGAARRTAALALLREGADRQLPLRGAQRHRLHLHGRRRPAAVPRLRLLRGAGGVHLRLQGPLGMQLAAGRRGRHRPEPRLLPAPLPRRGPARRLRGAVRRDGRGDRQIDRRDRRRTVPAGHRGRAPPTTACASSPCAS